MNETVKLVHLSSAGDVSGKWDSVFSAENARKAMTFHMSFPDYEPTPLVQLDNLAGILDLASVAVKDESKRFGLNAFKCLGGSFCIANYVAQKLGIPIDVLSYNRLISPEIRDRLGDMTFVTATDGNHGRGIAWTADRLGVRSVVFLPKGSSAERLNNIRALGAEAAITEKNGRLSILRPGKGIGWILSVGATRSDFLMLRSTRRVWPLSARYSRLRLMSAFMLFRISSSISRNSIGARRMVISE